MDTDVIKRNMRPLIKNICGGSLPFSAVRVMLCCPLGKCDKPLMYWQKNFKHLEAVMCQLF